MYEKQSKDVILQRMLDASPSDIDKRQGSVTYDLLSPAAIEIAHLYIELDNVLTFGFAGAEQPSHFLDLRAKEIGLTRRPGVKAVGEITFYGVDETLIPIGTEVSTVGENPIYFVTTENGTIISGEVTVKAVAREVGKRGNVSTGAIKLTTGNITGVVSVVNQDFFVNGADIESDSALLQRYYDRLRRPATSGNIWHYRQWALEVPGVGDVKVYPVWNGNGTVKVVVLSDDKRAASTAIVNDVFSKIEDNRPVGANVTVVPAIEIPIHVSATLVLEEGAIISEINQLFIEGLTQYLAELAFKDSIVRYTQIVNILLNISRIIDFSDLTVNGLTANLQIPDGNVAVAGTVNFSES